MEAGGSKALIAILPEAIVRKSGQERTFADIAGVTTGECALSFIVGPRNKRGAAPSFDFVNGKDLRISHSRVIPKKSEDPPSRNLGQRKWPARRNFSKPNVPLIR
jgi:hypothetical protein